MKTLSKLFCGDRVIWILFFLFCAISLVEVYSASSSLISENAYWNPILRHAILLSGGIVIAFVAHIFKPRYFSIFMLLLPISWLFLILVQIFGTTSNEANRFYQVGFLTFQPSELAKICLMVTVAFILSKRDNNDNGDKSLKWILILTAISCLLIFFDNLSTAAILFAVVFLLMFVGQIPLKKLGLVALCMGALGGLFLLFIMLAPDNVSGKVSRGATWKGRIESFFAPKEKLNPETYLSDKNFQRTHSQIAIARGGFFGKLPGNSNQREMLPEAHSDFIYSIIIEEFGIVGAAVVLFLYIILFVRAGQIAGRCNKLFPKLLVIGAALVIALQAFFHMAVAVGLAPITGQPLPLISKGGTSMWITSLYIGIILSVSRYENPAGIQKEEAIEQELEIQKQEVMGKPFWDNNTEEVQ